MHAKKGWLPAFDGYTREEEESLNKFAKHALEMLLYHKKEDRFFSDTLAYLADPEWEPETPSPKKRITRKPPKKKVSQQPPEPEVAALRASPPR